MSAAEKKLAAQIAIAAAMTCCGEEWHAHSLHGVTARTDLWLSIGAKGPRRHLRLWLASTVMRGTASGLGVPLMMLSAALQMSRSLSTQPAPTAATPQHSTHKGHQHTRAHCDTGCKCVNIQGLCYVLTGIEEQAGNPQAITGDSKSAAG